MLTLEKSKAVTKVSPAYRPQLPDNIQARINAYGFQFQCFLKTDTVRYFALNFIAGG